MRLQPINNWQIGYLRDSARGRRGVWAAIAFDPEQEVPAIPFAGVLWWWVRVIFLNLFSRWRSRCELGQRSRLIHQFFDMIQPATFAVERCDETVNDGNKINFTNFFLVDSLLSLSGTPDLVHAWHDCKNIFKGELLMSSMHNAMK